MMFGTLLKKELSEIFRGYFVNTKKNKGRSRAGTILLFVLFALLMGGLAAGVFGVVAMTLCPALVEAELGWMYYAIMGLIGILLGVFGSVFTTYTMLYIAKDNELLLSLPIPVKDIMGARLVSVYLMGLMYLAVVILPAVVVYCTTAPFSAKAVLGGIALLLIISVLVLVLSCLLGWVVAKISLKLKQKSIVTVLIALAGFGLYYFLYFRAMDLVQDLLANAQIYGEKIKGAAYGLYLFGRVGEGDGTAVLIFAAAAAVLFIVTWVALQRSFLKIVTSTGAVEKKVYREKAVKQKNVQSALLRKEAGRLVSSSGYMLNCGLATLLLPVVGVLLLVKGREVTAVLTSVFQNPSYAAVLLLAALCMLATMNNMAGPSVSLEGRNLWIIQSLPVAPWQALQAKLRLHLLLTGLPMLFCLVCAAAILPLTVPERILLIFTGMMITVMLALLSLFLGVKMPNTHWTNEMAAVKQGFSVAITILGGWLLSAAIAGIYLWKGNVLALAPYLGTVLGITGAASVLLYTWLRRRGAAAFAAL